jgi:hypothetical protein
VAARDTALTALVLLPHNIVEQALGEPLKK